MHMSSHLTFTMDDRPALLALYDLAFTHSHLTETCPLLLSLMLVASYPPLTPPRLFHKPVLLPQTPSTHSVSRTCPGPQTG